MNKHNAYLKDENLLTLFSLNNLIVPEIQREYVWGNNSDVLENFLIDLEKKASPCASCHHVHINKNINVGFLYSYKPLYVKYESERIMDEFLIDGQQRITTLFLLLLYRASVENRIDDFISICRADESEIEMGFNYKVRSLTQKFIMQLIQHTINEKEKAFDFISDMQNTPYWFLDDFRNDPTVMSMIAALQSIKKIFGDTSNFYFDYLLINIHFWHFKTEATSQGEELYITMNSRGEQLSDNEMQKARVLPVSELFNYGCEWERWQTFFWRNRKQGKANNPNADKGFNNFLACIEGLEYFNNPSLKGTTINVESIKIYIEGLMYICSDEFKNKVSTIYKGLYTDWFDSFISILWSEINKYDGKWDIMDPRGEDLKARKEYENNSIARNKSMIFWSWMTYFRLCHNNVSDELLIKILHFYYIRYQCYKRSSTSIETIIKCFIETNGEIEKQSVSLNDDNEEDNKNSRIFSEEEVLLSSLYSSDSSAMKEIESEIWKIQDLPYFIDGKGVGGNTIYDFFCDEEIIDKSNLLLSIKSLYCKITELLDGDSLITIKQILLFYVFDNKLFAVQQSPWYYTNYETSSWKRIVRSKHFISFYKEIVSSNMDCKEFLQKKRNEFFNDPENRTIVRNSKPFSHRKLLILYDFLCDGGIWDKIHENVVFWKNNNSESTEEIFIGQDTVWKGKRYYDTRLFLPLNWQEKLRDIGVIIIDNVPTLNQDNLQ